MNMTPELYYAALSCGMTLLIWVPNLVERIRILGLKVILYYQDGVGPSDPSQMSDWAKRVRRAHNNTIENLIPFIGLILILNSIGYSSELTILGAAIFFWSRLVYIICYIFGIPIIRTFSFIAGWFGTLIFMYEIFSSIKNVG